MESKKAPGKISWRKVCHLCFCKWSLKGQELGVQALLHPAV